jgi:hypothetical protein
MHIHRPHPVASTSRIDNSYLCCCGWGTSYTVRRYQPTAVYLRYYVFAAVPTETSDVYSRRVRACHSPMSISAKQRHLVLSNPRGGGRLLHMNALDAAGSRYPQ